MKKADRATIEIGKDGIIEVAFHQKRWENDEYTGCDRLYYAEIDRLKSQKDVKFAIGCFEVFVAKNKTDVIDKIIEKTKKEIKNLKNSENENNKAIMQKKESLEYLYKIIKDKKEIENAEYVEKIAIDYYYTENLRINYNGEIIEIDKGKTIEISRGKTIKINRESPETTKLLIFKNMIVKIEKY